MGADAAEEHSAQPTEAQRGRAWTGPLALAELVLSGAGAVYHVRSLQGLTSVPKRMNHRLESRVREIRTHGSEGGGTGTTGPPYLYVRLQWHANRGVEVPSGHALSGP